LEENSQTKPCDKEHLKQTEFEYKIHDWLWTSKS